MRSQLISVVCAGSSSTAYIMVPVSGCSVGDYSSAMRWMVVVVVCVGRDVIVCDSLTVLLSSFSSAMSHSTSNVARRHNHKKLAPGHRVVFGLELLSMSTTTSDQRDTCYFSHLTNNEAFANCTPCTCVRLTNSTHMLCYCNHAHTL